MELHSVGCPKGTNVWFRFTLGEGFFLRFRSLNTRSLHLEEQVAVVRFIEVLIRLSLHSTSAFSPVFCDGQQRRWFLMTKFSEVYA